MHGGRAQQHVILAPELEQEAILVASHVPAVPLILGIVTVSFPKFESDEYAQNAKEYQINIHLFM